MATQPPPCNERAAAAAPPAAAGLKFERDDVLGAPFGTLPGSSALGHFLAKPKVEVVLALPVLYCCALVAVQTLDLPPETEALLAYTERGISVFFAVEYAARWYSVSLRPGYLLKPSSLVDLVSFLPGLVQMMGVPDTPSLQFLRLLRVLRLQRYLEDYETYRNIFEEGLGLRASVGPFELEVARVLSSIFTLVFIATGCIYEAEHAVNPQIPDFFTALYFGLTTLTTVGFGDITPVTSNGRLVVCASILIGVAVIPAQLASLVEALSQKEERAVAPPVADYLVDAAKGQRDLGGGRWWRDAEIRSAFERHDINDSGRLDYHELRSALQALGADMDDREVVEMLQLYDDDGNGLMDLAEFSTMVKTTTSPRSLLCFMPPPEPNAEDRPLASLVCDACGESVHINTARFCHRCGSRI